MSLKVSTVLWHFCRYFVIVFRYFISLDYSILHISYLCPQSPCPAWMPPAGPPVSGPCHWSCRGPIGTTRLTHACTLHSLFKTVGQRKLKNLKNTQRKRWSVQLKWQKRFDRIPPSSPLSFIFSPTAAGEKENGRKDKRDVVTFS